VTGEDNIDLTPEQALALQMFAPDNVPCMMGDRPECMGNAVQVLLFTHEEATSCTYVTASPVCTLHSVGLQRGVHPFWRMWLSIPPVRCDKCEVPLRLARIVPIGNYA
jgi:hypothetical protein